VRPARPLGAGRADAPALRLVGAADASAPEVLEQARAAEERGRTELARELYDRALHRVRTADEAPVAHAALLASARLATAGGETTTALDILEAALASATARAVDADCASASALRSGVLWASGDIGGAEGEATRARDWARRAGDHREAAQCLRILGALAVARGSLDEGIALYESCLTELRALGQALDLATTLTSLAELYDDARRWDACPLFGGGRSVWTKLVGLGPLRQPGRI